jgi:hypothetical protein
VDERFTSKMAFQSMISGLKKSNVKNIDENFGNNNASGLFESKAF